MFNFIFDMTLRFPDVTLLAQLKLILLQCILQQKIDVLGITNYSISTATFFFVKMFVEYFQLYV